MTVAAVVVVPAAAPRRGASRESSRPLAAPLGRAPALVSAALESACDETIVVVGDRALAPSLPEEATVLLDDAAEPSEASALRVAADFAARAGHEALVVAYEPVNVGERHGALRARATAWSALAERAEDPGSPVLVATSLGAACGLARLDATVWATLPLGGRVEALWQQRPELASEVALDEAAGHR